MIFRLTLLTIFALLATFTSVFACDDHFEEIPEEWIVETEEELPHQDGPMNLSVDTVEFLVDVDEDEVPTGTATLRFQAGNEAMDLNIDEVALTLYHLGDRPLDVLYAELTDDLVLEFTLTGIDHVFEGEWSGYIQTINSDGVWGEMGEMIYFDPVRVHSTHKEPAYEAEVFSSGHDDMMGCDTTNNASAGTGLPLIFGVTALFLGLVRRRSCSIGRSVSKHHAG